MQLNTLSPEKGSKTPKKRLGRGIGSGLGKTAGRGHKGQYARSGGYHKVGFEGGQMPIQRRLPKFGFTSQQSLNRAEMRLDRLDRLTETDITLGVLKSLGLVRNTTAFVKIIGSGQVTRAITLKGPGLGVTKSAKAAIEQAGGRVVSE